MLCDPSVLTNSAAQMRGELSRCTCRCLCSSEHHLPGHSHRIACRTPQPCIPTPCLQPASALQAQEQPAPAPEAAPHIPPTQQDAAAAAAQAPQSVLDQAAQAKALDFGFSPSDLRADARRFSSMTDATERLLEDFSDLDSPDPLGSSDAMARLGPSPAGAGHTEQLEQGRAGAGGRVSCVCAVLSHVAADACMPECGRKTDQMPGGT